MRKKTTVTLSKKGKPVDVPAVEFEGHVLIIEGRVLRVAHLHDDFLYVSYIDNPNKILQFLKKEKTADIFHFLGSWQSLIGEAELPEWSANFHREDEEFAAIRVTSYDEWWRQAIKKQTRKRIIKAEKQGVEVKAVGLDEELLVGIVHIFNETPVRQGKPFWHYGKPLRQVNEEISTYRDRSTFLGAYWKGELVGFAKLINCRRFARANQVLALEKHRDKSVSNALIAGLVRACETLDVPYLVYGRWSEGSLGHFKENNGFNRLIVPRYYKALTPFGDIALRTGLHKGLKRLLPLYVRSHLTSLRRRWYTRKPSF